MVRVEGEIEGARDLEEHQEGHALDGVVPAIHIVSQEQIVGVWAGAPGSSS